MNIELEQYLWDRICKAGESGDSTPRDIINGMLEKNMIKSPRQAWATLRKWLKKEIYNYGIALDLGWKEIE